MIGHINLDKKVLGERSVGNPHAAFSRILALAVFITPFARP